MSGWRSTTHTSHMHRLWLTDPTRAYDRWQADEAASADHHPFAQRSIRQHRAMFVRFHRHLTAHGATLGNFGSDDIEAFWHDANVAADTAARVRFLKLMDRMCRHLVLVDLRASNPAAELMLADQWLQDDPECLYLSEEVDARLQEFVQPLSGDNPTQLRCRAIVAFFLGTGVTAGEGRMTRVQDLLPDAAPLYLHVPAKSQKLPRTIDLESFSVAPLSAWLAIRRKAPVYGDLLFTLKRTGTPITYMSLGKIVREAFDAIGFDAVDMSPRILRNTYCRRALLQGLQRDEITRRLGLSSNRTADRLAQTLRR